MTISQKNLFDSISILFHMWYNCEYNCPHSICILTHHKQYTLHTLLLRN